MRANDDQVCMPFPRPFDDHAGGTPYGSFHFHIPGTKLRLDFDAGVFQRGFSHQIHRTFDGVKEPSLGVVGQACVGQIVNRSVCECGTIVSDQDSHK
jgi:hypothetical protein